MICLSGLRSDRLRSPVTSSHFRLKTTTKNNNNKNNKIQSRTSSCSSWRVELTFAWDSLDRGVSLHLYYPLDRIYSDLSAIWWQQLNTDRSKVRHGDIMIAIDLGLICQRQYNYRLVTRKCDAVASTTGCSHP